MTDSLFSSINKNDIIYVGGEQLSDIPKNAYFYK